MACDGVCEMCDVVCVMHDDVCEMIQSRGQAWFTSTCQAQKVIQESERGVPISFEHFIALSVSGGC